MAYIDVDLDDIDTYELIDELENRYLNRREQEELLSLVKSNVEEQRKMKLMLSIIDKYSYQQLAEMFKEDFTVPVGKNQLALEL